MQTDEQISRAEVVNLLWQFKVACERDDADQLPFVHFNSLLNNQDYREQILHKTSHAEDDLVRRLATKLLEVSPPGNLIRPPNGVNGYSQAGATAGGAGAISFPPSSESGSAGGGSIGGARLVVGLLVLLLAFFAAAAWHVDLLKLRKHAVPGSILENTVWEAGRTYVLEQITYVEAGAKLVIEPGVTVMGKPGSALVVTRDAMLHARGRADAPIVFTSSRPAGQRKRGDWGGLVLLGNAPVNVPDAHIEGVDASDSRGDFGGPRAESSCGVLEYARIEFAGFEVYADNELNGLTLGGCGSSTVVRNVQVHRALDDGVEVFGGNVDLRHIVVTGAMDDAFDWDMGWRGRVQFLAVQMHPDAGDNAFEGDNLKDDPSRLPRSAPQFFNVTLVASPQAGKAQRAMTIRRGSGGVFHNFLISGFSAESIDIIGEESAMLALNDVLSFRGVAMADIGPGGVLYFDAEKADKDDDAGFNEILYFTHPARDNRLGAKLGLGAAALDITAPDFVPDPKVQALPNPQPIPQGEFWDESAVYLGAIRPGVTRGWLEGWTAFPPD